MYVTFKRSLLPFYLETWKIGFPASRFTILESQLFHALLSIFLPNKRKMVHMEIIWQLLNDAYDMLDVYQRISKWSVWNEVKKHLKWRVVKSEVKNMCFLAVTTLVPQQDVRRSILWPQWIENYICVFRKINTALCSWMPVKRFSWQNGGIIKICSKPKNRRCLRVFNSIVHQASSWRILLIAKLSRKINFALSC